MIEEAPNVVTVDGLRGLLAEGYLLEVVCKEAGEKRHNSWYGTWVVRAVAEDGRADKMLVTSRSYLKVREFKTIVGLVSFLAEMGCKSVSIPLEEGGRERHAAPGRVDAPWTGPVLVSDN
jgi:stalled ribosome rescue protein Dom34